MKAAPLVYEALARALTPPRGEARAFLELGLAAPEPDALAAEHATLFGRSGRAVLAPYEGVHRGTTLHEVLSTYASFGFAPHPSFRDRPDHVCLQLALAAALSRRVQAAAEGASALAAHEDVRRFLHLRIWPWVPAWFETLTSLDDGPAHRSLGLVAVEFLAREGARWGAPRPGRRNRKEPAAQPRCAECGQPVGFAPPRGDVTLPAWTRVCAGCRIRFDLRRIGS